MIITDILDNNARLYAGEVALVEINPMFEPQSRITWRDYALMQPEPGQPWPVKMVHVLFQPEDQLIDVPRHKAKNVERLLATLGLRPATAIVACGDTLLTPDTPLYPTQKVLVRKVMSSG